MFNKILLWARDWLQDNVNFCADYANGREKPENKVYSWFRRYWFWPFEDPHCDCCAAVRGLIYGSAIGFIIGRLL